MKTYYCQTFIIIICFIELKISFIISKFQFIIHYYIKIFFYNFLTIYSLLTLYYY